MSEFQISLERDGTAPHDLWINDTDSLAMTALQLRGREIFISESCVASN